MKEVQDYILSLLRATGEQRGFRVRSHPSSSSLERRDSPCGGREQASDTNPSIRTPTRKCKHSENAGPPGVPRKCLVLDTPLRHHLVAPTRHKITNLPTQ